MQEEASYIEKLTNDKFWKQYIDTYFENRKETLIRDFKSNKEVRDECAGGLKEVDKFYDHLNELRETYKELKEGKED